MLRTDIEPFDGTQDLWLPANQLGNMCWVKIERLLELLTALSDELGGECDDEIGEVFPYWRAHRMLQDAQKDKENKEC